MYLGIGAWLLTLAACATLLFRSVIRAERLYRQH